MELKSPFDSLVAALQQDLKERDRKIEEAEKDIEEKKKKYPDDALAGVNQPSIIEKINEDFVKKVRNLVS